VEAGGEGLEEEEEGEEEGRVWREGRS